MIPTVWTRRRWLAGQTGRLVAIVAASPLVRGPRVSWRPAFSATATPGTPSRARLAAHREHIDPTSWATLAQQGVDAARAAGAQYADARLTRVVSHRYYCGTFNLFGEDTEMLGVGIRALFNGYWGFAASTIFTPDAIAGVARDAVAQARENAKGPARPVDFTPIPVARGSWTTPIHIDPFQIPLEEKIHYLDFWTQCGRRVGFHRDPFQGWIGMVRQERMVATSDGSLFLQRLYESGGSIRYPKARPNGAGDLSVFAHGLDIRAKGWELFLEAKLPDQMEALKAEWDEAVHPTIATLPVPVGRYTLVCDGATMASLMEATVGVATQLDRALGYEANASGTSFLDAPLTMVGQQQISTPAVTVTANRSTPEALATVQWDDEGVTPASYPLVKHGVLMDFQTTREQAAWLAPYYQKAGRPLSSRGCAAAEDAHSITLQQMPNLSLEPNPANIALTDLIADVNNGILMEEGSIDSLDFQARNGILSGRMRKIQNGRLGPNLSGGAVLFNTQPLLKKIVTVGGAATQRDQHWSQYDVLYGDARSKGQPPQRTSHSVRAAAAIIADQAIIDPNRKA